MYNSFSNIKHYIDIIINLFLGSHLIKLINIEYLT